MVETLETNVIVNRIKQGRKKLNVPEDAPLAHTDMETLFEGREWTTLLSLQEAALILTEIAGRTISPDYVKLLRRQYRLPIGKRINSRTYLFSLRGIADVKFKAPGEKGTRGRPPGTKKEFSAITKKS